ncbi:hypothetical protein [Deinococcus soli (ex Cha et al. 2016)]|uniref:hypothetical protein n=1 Tax=Deinococcus soli (ex Cha et al. 2016) TaxID=1309411 RepID=UPI00166D6F51|nr:hypothetical protein [Deinococcus soli (ex Cha et al. 2016)]GGB69577.1 hypothetical protein GCM10008019_27220 [Deinococcus soli (ex Cha et al. 2016)]
MAEWTWHEFLDWLDGCCCRQELPPGSCVEGIVVAAHAGAVTVRLDTGQAVRGQLTAGSYPRPGARVRVCFDGVHHVDQRTLHQPRRPSFTPDDAPDVPRPPSFGTGQRPSNFGMPHVPQTGPDGHPVSQTGSADGFTRVTLDSGEIRRLDVPTLADHQARVLHLATVITGQRDAPEQAPGELLTINERFWEYALQRGGQWEAELSSRPAASTFTRVFEIRRDRTLAYATGEESGTPDTRSRSNPSAFVRFRWRAGDADPWQEPLSLRLRAQRFTLPPGQTGPGGEPTRLEYAIQGLVTIGEVQDWQSVVINQTWYPPVDPDAATDAAAWPFALHELRDLPAWSGEPDDPIPTAFSAPVTGFAYTTDVTDEPTLPQPTGPRWLSPDGRVRIEGPLTTDHAALHALDTLHVGDTVSIPGPGSWAAYRGARGQTVLLIEAGGQVTRVDLPPPGQTPTVQAVPLATWLAALEIPAQDWVGFARSGPLFSAWPPHEALTRDPDGISG